MYSLQQNAAARSLVLFPGFGERPVDDRAAGTIERNTLALRGGLEAVGGEHDAGIAKLVIKSAHRLEHLGRGRMPFSLSSVAFTSTITRTVCLLLEPA